MLGRKKSQVHDLSAGSKIIWIARLLAGIGEPHVIAETELEFDCAGYPFKAKAKQVVKNGWKDVVEWILGGKNKKDDDSDEDKILQNLDFFQEGKSIPAREPECKEGKTTAKKHFTEDTLLSAMEHARGCRA